MRLLLFTIVLVGLGGAATAVHTQATIGKVKAGVDAAKAITDVIIAQNFTENFAKIGTIATKIGPFLGAIGPALALVSILLPKSPSREMILMQKEFAKIDAKFDQVFSRFSELENLVQKAGLKAQYAQYEHTIQSLSTKLEELLGATSGDVASYKRFFTGEYSRSYDGATFKIWNGMMEDTNALSDNIALTAMQYYDNDRKKVQAVMKGVLNLILQGIKVELAYQTATGHDADYNVKQRDWEAKVNQLLAKLKRYDQTVKGNFQHQVEIDVPAKLAKWEGESNSQFATNLYNFLNEKYDWRDFHVLAYNELSGDNHHYVKWCGGYKSFREKGRNLVVASVDKSKHHIDTTSTGNTLTHVHTRHCLSNGHRCVSYNAVDVYKSHMSHSYTSGCTYASVGVIEKDAGIAHKAASHRLVVKVNGKYELHAFG